ncbi:MAG TPA: UDP-glucuronic acid decarboxylase family protein [Actinomycetota bacterium]|nr:UDP-glucuronic acid decarboxylase family protein [Actinomycetota bacterium]
MPTALVTGGAGFLGSHLCERLVREGWDVVCHDSLLTGDAANLDHLGSEPRFRFEERDVTVSVDVEGPVDWVLHFASPASPRDYLELPIETLQVGSLGRLNALELARDKGAGFMVASTSEVYGDPKEHPQNESYWGHVNPIGPRSVYDEAKRFTEAATMAFHRTHGVPVRIIRIFNTYGPRMRRNDGRAVPNFVEQALNGRPITIYGDGSQTRSLCYVDDLIEGIYRFLRSDERGPMNIGNPHEVSILELARMINEAAGGKSELVFEERPVDDPEMRRPDIGYARSALGWEPVVPLEEGLARTMEWAAAAWA